MDVPPVPPPPPDPSEGPVGFDATPSKSRRGLISVLIVVLVAAGVGAAVVLSSDDDPSGGSASETPSVASPSASPEPDPVAKPAGLKAKAGSFKVDLRWKLSQSGEEPTGFSIRRNDKVVASLEEDTFRWIDQEAVPETRYTYDVIPLSAAGAPQADRAASISVKTLTAAPFTARISGVYNVKFDDTSHFGYSTFPQEPTAGWRFIPKCDEGTCNMKMSTIQKNGYSVDLTKRAGYYDGTTSFRGLASCGGSPTTSTLTFRIEVANAASVKGRWRAIAITGTFTQRESPQLGCVSSGANFDIFGKLVQ